MSKVSAIIIAKNEQNYIRKCIEDLSFCEEIIVVDNDSTDKTAEIAQSLGAEVFDFASNDFSEIRNFALTKAQFDWVLYIDADEECDQVLKKEIKNSTENSAFEAFLLNRKNFYLGDNQWPYIEKIPRLFKKQSLLRWEGEIHESPKVNGKIGKLDGFIIHNTHKDLESMVEKTIAWSTTEAQLRFKTDHPKMSWWRFPRVMITAFIKSYVLEQGYRAKTAGLIESLYQAFSIFITYAKLWELQKNKK